MRRGQHDCGSSGLLESLPVRLHRVPRLPEDRRLARRLLRLLQHVRSRLLRLRGGQGLRPRPCINARRSSRHAAVRRPGHGVVAPAVRRRRQHTAARGLPQLLPRRALERQRQADHVQVPRGLGHPGTLHARGPHVPPDRSLHLGVFGGGQRQVRPPAWDEPEAGGAGREDDAPSRLPQFRHPRVAGGQPLRRDGRRTRSDLADRDRLVRDPGSRCRAAADPPAGNHGRP